MTCTIKISNLNSLVIYDTNFIPKNINKTKSDNELKKNEFTLNSQS